MKNLILLIEDKGKLDRIFRLAMDSKKYDNVAKYRNVAWAQIYNTHPDEVRIICDSYLDYSQYNSLLGFAKYCITHGIDTEVVIQDMQEFFEMQAVTVRKPLKTEIRTVKYHDKNGNPATVSQNVRVETPLLACEWARVEEQLKDLKRLFSINKNYYEAIVFQNQTVHTWEELLSAYGAPENPNIDELLMFVNLYAPAYGLDTIYLPIERASFPREWILNRRNIKLDKIHDEKARLSRVIQTLPKQFETEIRLTAEAIKFYQKINEPWLPEYEACPECGSPINIASEQPQCKICALDVTPIWTRELTEQDLNDKYTEVSYLTELIEGLA